jgi:hypothetical protein
MTPTFIATALMTLLVAGGPVAADAEEENTAPPAAATATEEATETAAATEEAGAVENIFKGRDIHLQYFRPADMRGLNTFETTKEPGVEYTGFKLDFGAAFTSQVQALDHRNAAVPVINPVNGLNNNELQDIGFGFNTSTANLALHAQLAPGIRVQLTTYLSSRHHNETWVKDGFIQIDESPIDFVPLKALMQFVTLKVGHMEVNYGDAHYRRSDNGNAMYNPFVGNYIMDAFTTEVGAEAYLKTKGIIAMAGVTGGEIRGTVVTPGRRGPAFLGKLGVDRQVNEDLRVRLTGSMYRTQKAMSSTLYGGDRAGSRYYWVLENTQATESTNFTSGLLNPGFRNKVTALQVNPFVKFRSLELFGVLERAEGRAATETVDRTWNQVAVDAVYRFLPGGRAYVGTRFNRVEGELLNVTGDVGAKRWQFGGGWFITPAVLAKVEYVKQEYFGYPTADIKNGGEFDGFMLEGVVAF